MSASVSCTALSDDCSLLSVAGGFFSSKLTSVCQHCRSKVTWPMQHLHFTVIHKKNPFITGVLSTALAAHRSIHLHTLYLLSTVPMALSLPPYYPQYTNMQVEPVASCRSRAACYHPRPRWRIGTRPLEYRGQLRNKRTLVRRISSRGPAAPSGLEW